MPIKRFPIRPGFEILFILARIFNLQDGLRFMASLSVTFFPVESIRSRAIPELSLKLFIFGVVAFLIFRPMFGVRHESSVVVVSQTSSNLGESGEPSAFGLKTPHAALCMFSLGRQYSESLKFSPHASASNTAWTGGNALAFPRRWGRCITGVIDPM